MNEWLQHSAVHLAKSIRMGEISCQELLQIHIDRILEVNPTINALVEDRFDVAMKEAIDADQLITSRTEDLPPFHGVPCTIKECFALEGMPQSSGLLSRKSIRVQDDAPTVSNLRKAGFIPMGVTNLSELCMWMESNNKVYGRSNNPYDPERTVGGSSGGEGAIVGAGGSPLGLGSDIGGSIRMPAFFNGVFGHKPSPGIISNKGQYPIAENEALNYLCTGPICRRAEDLPALSKVLAGEKADLFQDVSVDVREMKILNISDDGRIAVSTELRNAQQKVVEYFRRQGMQVEDIQIDGLRRSVEIWSAMLEMAGGKSFRELLFDGGSRSVLRECLRYGIGRSDHTLPALALVVLEQFSKFNRRQLERFYKMGEELQKEFRRLLAGNTIALYPSHAMVAPKHGRSIMTPWNWAYTAIINTMKLPATQIPLGLNSQGIPLGIQVIANERQDHLCFAVAAELEKEFGGWVPPSRSFVAT